MDVKEYMNRLKSRYDKPYIQIPRNLISELNLSLEKHGAERYTDYAFSFLIANAFLYKYTHYVDYEVGDYLLLSDIKRLLKYNPNNQNINKVSKKGSGVLDYESYVEITRDIPISVEYNVNNDNGFEIRKPVRLSEVDWIMSDEVNHNILRTSTHYVYIPEFMIDYPVKKGTLNDYTKTVKITYKEFEYFILNDKMTLKEFLVYCFIKSSIVKYGQASISQDRARRGIGVSHVTFNNIIDSLSDKGVIEIINAKNIDRFKKLPRKFTISPSFMKKVGIMKL